MVSMCVINNYLMLFSATTRAEISPSVMFYENSEKKKTRIVLNDILIAFRIIFESFCYNVTLFTSLDCIPMIVAFESCASFEHNVDLFPQLNHM